MENNEISFNLFDNMIHNEPMRWQSFECDLEAIHFFYITLTITSKTIQFTSCLWMRFLKSMNILFEDCTIEELTDIRDELLVCLN